MHESEPKSLYPFVNHTTYDRRALAALNQLAEQSVRKQKSLVTRFLCFLLGITGLAVGSYIYTSQTLIGSLLLLYGVLLLLVGISWNSFRLRSSQRQLQQGMRECIYEFHEDALICTTASGTTRYSYHQAFAVVENADWYAIFFDTSHGIVLDKSGFTQGDPLSFKPFIGQHTQLPIQEF